MMELTKAARTVLKAWACEERRQEPKQLILADMSDEREIVLKVQKGDRAEIRTYNEQ